jgi:hypothetical protein
MIGWFGFQPAIAQAVGASSVGSSVWSTNGIVDSVLPAGKKLVRRRRAGHALSTVIACSRSPP